MIFGCGSETDAAFAQSLIHFRRVKMIDFEREKGTTSCTYSIRTNKMIGLDILALSISFRLPK